MWQDFGQREGRVRDLVWDDIVEEAVKEKSI